MTPPPFDEEDEDEGEEGGGSLTALVPAWFARVNRERPPPHGGESQDDAVVRLLDAVHPGPEPDAGAVAEAAGAMLLRWGLRWHRRCTDDAMPTGPMVTFVTGTSSGSGPASTRTSAYTYARDFDEFRDGVLALARLAARGGVVDRYLTGLAEATVLVERGETRVLTHPGTPLAHLAGAERVTLHMGFWGGTRRDTCTRRPPARPALTLDVRSAPPGPDDDPHGPYAMCGVAIDDLCPDTPLARMDHPDVRVEARAGGTLRDAFAECTLFPHPLPRYLHSVVTRDGLLLSLDAEARTASAEELGGARRVTVRLSRANAPRAHCGRSGRAIK